MVKMSILVKLVVAILVLALVPMGVLGYFSFTRITGLETISKENIGGALRTLGEQVIEKKALSAAKELEVYFKSHPGYTLADLRRDSAFREIAVQKVGQTGYTAVHELGTGINRFHVNPKVEDTDLHTLATKLPEFWRIMESHLNGTITNGYYAWQDADGKIRDKFMVCVPVPGSEYGIAATTYIDEFQEPWTRTYQHIDAVTNQTVHIFLLTMILTVIFAVLLSVLFSRRVTQPLLHLADVADRISLGELDVKVASRTNDEIGVLADSIRRMQISLRAAVERLRKRRRGLL